MCDDKSQKDERREKDLHQIKISYQKQKALSFLTNRCIHVRAEMLENYWNDCVIPQGHYLNE